MNKDDAIDYGLVDVKAFNQAHDKALQSAYQEYGRYIQAGEGSLKAIERAIEVYNYAIPSTEILRQGKSHGCGGITMVTLAKKIDKEKTT